MQEVKTVDLAGPALDWAIAQIEGVEVAIYPPQYQVGWLVARPYPYGKYSPSTDWAVAGPLVDKYHVSLIYAFEEYEALIGMTGSGYHSRAITAACQAIVRAKLGDTVQVPAELLTPTPR